jgi:hypothetical protein
MREPTIYLYANLDDFDKDPDQLKKVQEADLVGIIVMSNMPGMIIYNSIGDIQIFIVKSRLTKNNITVSFDEFNRMKSNVIKNLETSTISHSTITNQFKIKDPLRTYLFAIEEQQEHRKMNELVTCFVRSIKFDSQNSITIEFLMDENDSVNKFFKSMPTFTICLLKRDGSVAKRYYVRHDNGKFKSLITSTLSHDGDIPNPFVTCRATIDCSIEEIK